MQIYEIDYDNRFPATGWADELSPYYKNKDMMNCPTVWKEKQSKFGYAMNAAVMGVNAEKVQDPADSVIFFETDALGRGVVANLAARNVDRHKGKSNVSYLDGHAKTIPKGQAP